MSETLAERLRQITADDNDEADVLFDAADLIEELQDEIERLRSENERLRKALATYACRCGDGDCYKDEFVASCGRSAREALGLILNANSLLYAQEIASKALSEQDTSPCPTNTIK